MHHLTQVGPDDPTSQRLPVLLSLFVAIAAKPCFHALRTEQRLGYTASCSTHTLHGTIGFAVRLQSAAEKGTALLQARVEAWLTGFRGHLEGGRWTVGGD